MGQSWGWAGGKAQFHHQPRLPKSSGAKEPPLSAGLRRLRAPIQAGSGNVAPSSRAESQLTPSPSFLTFILGSALPPICHQRSPFIKPRASLASPQRHCL